MIFNNNGVMKNKEEKLLSIVIPAFNEEDVLEVLYGRLKDVLDSINMNSEMIFINDGSQDGTLSIIEKLQQTDSRIGIIDFSRNFGKEIAMTAGLDYASGDAVVIIDADLQHPPELIPELIKYWETGYDVVYARRGIREGESFLKKQTSKWFYRVMKLLSTLPIPEDSGDFRLLSRRSVNALNQLRERQRFMKGLFSWIGFSQKAVLYEEEPRYAGKTKWNYWKLWNFALEGITSFTEVPLKLATYIGLFVSGSSFIYGLWIIIKTIIWGDPVAGYPSLMTVILFLSGVQLLTLGIIGEYLGRMFSETKNRPLYLINKYVPSQFENFKFHVS